MRVLVLLSIACAGADPDADGDGSLASVDCDDDNALVYPDAVETCDDLDNNCNDEVDEGLARPFHVDADGDTYGTKEIIQACDTGPGIADDATDCDDSDPAIHPEAEELCNGHDDDCDGEDRLSQSWYEDADADGFGNATTETVACDAPSGFVSDATDCDDANPAVNPSAVEDCENTIDDDCNGVAADDEDHDGDGYFADECAGGGDCDDTDAAIHFGALEVCGDGIDTDCSGYDLFCGFAGTHDLAAADAFLTADNHGSDDAGRLVEAGDVTGDGNDDIFIATLYANDGYGGGWIVPGPVYGDDPLPDVGFRLVSTEVTSGASRSIGLGDANGDGIEDVAFGCPYAVAPGQFIVYGPITADMDIETDRDASLVVTDVGGLFGHGSDLGDIDDDGFEDGVVAAWSTSSGGDSSGTIWVAYGPLAGDTHIDTSSDGMIAGEHDGAFAGRMIHAGEDVNGDGIGDFGANAVGDSTAGPSAGAVYVVYGPGDISSLADASILIGPAAEAETGTSFTFGDYDADGYADVASTAGLPGFGGVYIARGPLPDATDLADADVIIESEYEYQTLGSGLGSGDTDGDGTSDLLIGAPGDENLAGARSGAAWLVYAPPSGTWTLSEVAQASFFGTVETGGTGTGVAIGDLNHDGGGDLIIGAPGAGVGGGVYVEYAEL